MDARYDLTLLKYRHALRGLLHVAGVGTNPGMADDQLLDEIALKLIGRRIEWMRCDACRETFPGSASLALHKGVCRS